MKKDEILDLVDRLNEQTHPQKGESGIDWYTPFEVRHAGWSETAIFFMGLCIWTEDSDTRKTLDNGVKEDLETHIIQTAKEITEDLVKKMNELGHPLCEHCEEPGSFYLGMTCPHCRRPCGASRRAASSRSRP